MADTPNDPKKPKPDSERDDLRPDNSGPPDSVPFGALPPVFHPAKDEPGSLSDDDSLALPPLPPKGGLSDPELYLHDPRRPEDASRDDLPAAYEHLEMHVRCSAPVPAGEDRAEVHVPFRISHLCAAQVLCADSRLGRYASDTTLLRVAGIQAERIGMPDIHPRIGNRRAIARADDLKRQLEWRPRLPRRDV